MKRRKTLFPILLIFLISISCKNEPLLDNDLLAGTVRVLDRSIPFPFLLERTGESIHLLNYKNELIDSTSEHREQYEPMDTIKMRDHQFVVIKTSPHLLLFDISDSLRFPYNSSLYSAQFVKTVQSEEIELSAFRQNLEENIFQTEVKSAHMTTPNRDLKVIKTMDFTEDSLQTIHTYYYKNHLVFAEKEVAGIYIFERKGKIFFSKAQEPDTPETLYQISSIKDKSFVLRTFNYNEEIIERLEISKDPPSTEKVRAFDRCMEGQPGEYYHDNLTFSKGNEYLIRKIGKNAPEASGDGYITVHFTINCKGQMGHLGLEQMDREFESTSFHPNLVKHIITQVMDLKDWPEIKPGTFYRDIHSFLMFRIKNGKITDLCP